MGWDGMGQDRTGHGGFFLASIHTLHLNARFPRSGMDGRSFELGVDSGSQMRITHSAPRFNFGRVQNSSSGVLVLSRPL